MELPIYQVDAFTNNLFGGNPAAVVLCEPDLPEATMQAIAAENNLADTAFVFTAKGERAIRWFTPTVEVNLCGHATLAAAHVLFHHLGCDAQQVSFSSRSGMLYVERNQDLLVLDFPTDTLTEVEKIPQDLLDGLSQPVTSLYRGRNDLLAILENENQIRSLQPDLARLARLPCRGVIVSSRSASVDFVSRFFAPQSGIDEDPATGSAHTTLTPFWSRHLNKSALTAQQLSPRGAELFCQDRGERTAIAGRAKTFLIGKIYL